ncbi:tyrosine-type recombinase/integrase [Mycobacteroides franklinii]|uniref:tyrosine-type recombinase/integrase n=1 Tax=Mycobacteroides franklinii TaxID=948102 RepID=UPI000A09B6FA|nr:tyrosine-type recombinase/integrase [Mycobacteroides franklinii]ORA58466.1 hypothetical protein BST24_20835 [Mycobacteroides franklinii]
MSARGITWYTVSFEGLHPHTLRPTHATALAKAGWTAPEIAARLGQSHASSADVYIHLAAMIWRPEYGRPSIWCGSRYPTHPAASSADGHRGWGTSVAGTRCYSIGSPPCRFPLALGHWTLDVWPVREAPDDSRRATQERCAVGECGRDVYWLGNDIPGSDRPRPDLGLCYAHYFRWWRSGKDAVPVRDWLRTNPAPIGRPRGRADVDYLGFRGLPRVVAHKVIVTDPLVCCLTVAMSGCFVSGNVGGTPLSIGCARLAKLLAALVTASSDCVEHSIATG